MRALASTELVIITASQTNACQFCVSSHCDLVALAERVLLPWRHVGRDAGPAH